MNSSLIHVFAVAFFANTLTHSLMAKGPIVPSDTVITLSRSGMYRSFPGYVLIINADGSLIFDGNEFTKAKGKQKSTIRQDQIQELIAEFDKTKFFSLNDRYERKEDGCLKHITDQQSVTISISINGKKKAIRHYFGCVGAPPELIRLENKIDEIADSKRWVQ